MEVNIKTFNNSLKVRENGGLMEITIKNEDDYCVMFVDKKEAKKNRSKIDGLG